MPNKPGGNVGKPGGSGNAKPKPKYVGPPVIDVGAMTPEDRSDACKFMAHFFYYRDQKRNTGWAGTAVVGKDVNTIVNLGVTGADMEASRVSELQAAHPDWNDVQTAYFQFLLNQE